MKKKILALLLTVVMMFAMASVAWAAEPGQLLVGDGLPPYGNASYIVEAPAPTTSVNVTFIMEAPDEYWNEEGAFYYEVPVTLTASEAQVFTVSDLLVQVAENNANFQFTTKSGNSAYPFTKDSVYLYGVTHNGITWQPEDFDLWGWEYRINDLYPVKYNDDLKGYEGTSSNETYISNGDVIHFFWDYPVTLDGFNYSTNFVRLETTAEIGSVAVQVQGQQVHIDSATLVMGVYNYENLGSATAVELYDSTGNLIASGTTDDNGQITLSDARITAGEYILKSTSKVLENDPQSDYNGFLFTQTSGYKVLNIK